MNKRNSRKNMKKSKDHSGGHPEYAHLPSSLAILYRFGGWINRSGFYRPFEYAPQTPKKMFARLVGPPIFGSQNHAKAKIHYACKTLFPHHSEKFYKKVIQSNLSYIALMFIDLLFDMPYFCPRNIDRFVKFKNTNYLDQALLQKKGVILPILHIGQFFDSLTINFKQPKNPKIPKYDIVILGSLENSKMFEAKAAKHDTIFVVIAEKYSKIKKNLIEHLENNRIVAIYYDIATKNQLRTQFDESNNSFLIPTPQSIIALHKETGAPIIPTGLYPTNGEINKQTVIFHNPSEINKISKQYRNASKREYHGRLSIELNKILHPYIRKYAHIWEELIEFGSWRRKLRINFPKLCNFETFLKDIQITMHEILDMSFEIGREDIQIHSIIDEIFSTTIKNLKNPSKPIFKNKTYIDHFAKDGKSELIKIARIASFQLKKYGEVISSNYLFKLIQKIKNMEKNIKTELEKPIEFKQIIN